MFRWADPKPEEVKTPPPPSPDPRIRLMKWFSFSHLPEELRPISSKFNELASWMLSEIPESAEAYVAMRKLLEVKDAAIRAFMESMIEPHKTDNEE